MDPLVKFPATQSFDVLFAISLNNRLINQSSCRWFKTSWRCYGFSEIIIRAVAITNSLKEICLYMDGNYEMVIIKIIWHVRYDQKQFLTEMEEHKVVTSGCLSRLGETGTKLLCALWIYIYTPNLLNLSNMYVCLLHTEVFNTHIKLISKGFVVYFPGFCLVTTSFHSNLGCSSNHIHAFTLMWCTSEISFVTPCGPLHPLDFRRKEHCVCSTDFSYLPHVEFWCAYCGRISISLSQVTCKPSQSMRDKVRCVKHDLIPWFRNECKCSPVTYSR